MSKASHCELVIRVARNQFDDSAIFQPFSWATVCCDARKSCAACTTSRGSFLGIEVREGCPKSSRACQSAGMLPDEDAVTPNWDEIGATIRCWISRALM